MALPPTATAWSGWRTSTPSKNSAMWSRSARISAGPGGSDLQELLGERAGADLERVHLVHALGEAAEDDLRGAAADVDDADLALDRVAERLRRAEEGEPALLLVAEDLDRQAGEAADLLRRLVAVLGLADRGGGDDPDRLGAELVGEPDLSRDDVGDLGDLLVGDLAAGLGVAADLRVGALLHDLAQLALVGLGDEHARGVGADVDRRSEHVPGGHPFRPPCGRPPEDAPGGERRATLDLLRACVPLASCSRACRCMQSESCRRHGGRRYTRCELCGRISRFAGDSAGIFTGS